MRKAPIGPVSNYFVSYEDNKGRYTEVNFELKKDAQKFMRGLKKLKVESELWTRNRVFPEV